MLFPRREGHNPDTNPPADHSSTSAQRIALARVKRATSQLARWHTEYEDALTDAHDLGVSDRTLEEGGEGRRLPRPTSEGRTTASPNPGVGHTGRVVDEERPEAGDTDTKPMPDAAGEARPLNGVQGPVPSEIRDVSFPVAVRGYDRRAVDTYVKEVNRVIAELEISRSPQAAVRHALDRVGEQTSGILRRAGETAEEIIAGAHMEADETTARAKSAEEKIKASASAEADETIARANSEADEVLARSQAESAERMRRVEEEIDALQEEADTRLRELKADTDAIRQERGELVDEIRQLVGRLEEIVSDATARGPERHPAESRAGAAAADD